MKKRVKPTTTGEDRIRVLVVGREGKRDEGSVRIRGVLSANPRFEVLGAAGPHESRWSVRAMRPDVILLEIGESTTRAREFLASLPPDFGGSVLLAALDTPIGEIARLLQAGARGVYCKSSPVLELPKAIIKVLYEEKIWIDPAYFQPLIAAAVWAGTPAAELCTKQELEILTWVRRGLGNKEIAERLGISLTGVKAGLQRLFRKYSVRKRAQLISAVDALTGSLPSASD